MSATRSRDNSVKRKNVQVVVRVRPLSETERSLGNKNIVSSDFGGKTVSLKNVNASDSLRFIQGQKCFGSYDKVFGPESTQLEVYEGVLAPLMKEVLNGYNCTVFAYGQTGSGKTFTMEGRHDDSNDYTWNTDPTAGIIPRALQQIFSELGVDIDYTVRVSFVELYNEQIFDLLSRSENSQLESLRIFDDKEKGVSIIGAEEVIVLSLKEVYDLLRRGAEKRRTATTLINMTSSRSHSVFTISVMIREPGLVDGEELLRQGKLNLVDLAGSENIARSGATDIRAREAGNINTSLLALGRVINALTMGSSHIPYRESKLTRILQDSLGGKTITTIIATISPASSNFEESVNTLDYAQRAKNIKNNPEVNLRITRKGLLKEYKDEIDRLRRDLLAAREEKRAFLDQEKSSSVQKEPEILSCEKSHEPSTSENSDEIQKGKVAEIREKLQKGAQSADDIRSLEQQLNQMKESQTSTQLELEEIRKRELALINENTLLRQNFAECLQKAENGEKKVEEIKQKQLENNKFILEDLRKKLAATECQRDILNKENARLREQFDNINKNCEEKVEQIKQVQRRSESCDKLQLNRLQFESDLNNKKYEEAKATLVDLDAQCERLMQKLQKCEFERNSYKNDFEQMRAESGKLRSENSEFRKLQSENLSLKSNEKLLERKIVDLEQKGAKSADDIRSLEQQLNQMKELQTSTQLELEEIRKRELALINENTLLRQNFAECLQKAENFRDQFKASNEENDKIKLELKIAEEKKVSLEDRLQEALTDLEQKSKLVAYLQSVMQPKQMQKLPRPRPSLLSSESDYISEIESEYKQCQQLEQQRDELKNDLELKRRVLAETQNNQIIEEDEIVPLINVRRSIRDQQSCETFSQTTSESLTLKTFVTGTNSNFTPGKMRHDIPHRFPYFTYVYRCRDCNMVVHKHCKVSVVNTCGLPYECADFYLDAYSGGMNGEQMTGWIKLLVLPASTPSGATRFSTSSPVTFAITEKWQNAWAMIEKHSLNFYESDQLALQRNGPPFININLDHEQWRIYNQTTEKPLGGVKENDMSMLIELRMPNRTLLMLTPTSQAKQRWVQALQQATNRRIFIQRRPSSTIVTNQLLLSLEKPRNLCINCTQWLPYNNGNEYLLIGAQEGLFAAAITQNRAPFQIAGIFKVFWMEFLSEFDMLLTICDSSRRLGAIHSQQLNRALRADQQPSVYVTTAAPNIEQCHIAVVSKVEHNRGKRFVYVATIDSIYILQYVVKLGVFSTIRQILTEEPPIAICSTQNGFIFGADNFRFLSNENNFGGDDMQLAVDNCPYDFPVAVVEISDNEFLLAFH
uniref:Kinesin-like protein n=1 Tax=Meloidogyne javanica TaxID=6303 RepID=A0A915NA19_MELJA